MLSQRSLRLSLLLFILLCFSYFYRFIFQLIFCSSVSFTLLLILSSIFLISDIVLFIIDCLSFNPFRSLLNIYCIFLTRASSLFIHVSILCSRFWIIFNIITLNAFSGECLFPLHLFGLVGFYHVPSSTACFCLFILFSLLYLRSPFCGLEGRSSS